jgi:FixJ family two-component response regulator
MYRMMIIDDDANLLEVLGRKMESQGFECTLCESAEEALSKWAVSTPFHCVLSDYKLPKLTGFDFLSFLQEQNDLTPVVLLTGFADEKMATRALSLGAFDFVSKPFHLNDLIRIMKSAGKVGQDWLASKKQIQEFLENADNPKQLRAFVSQLLSTQKSDKLAELLRHNSTGKAS